MRKFRHVSTPLLAGLILSACSGGERPGPLDDETMGPIPPETGSPMTVPPSGTDPSPGGTNNNTGLGVDWHKKGVFMEIYVRGFKDSNGDGIGDFKGLTQSLDYLSDLGITGIWLMPMTKSCDRDHGYAVCDHRQVEPDYGTFADFDELLAEAHKRGIGVIIDYVMNHGGRESPMFQDSAKSADSAYRNWYMWQDIKPTGWVNWGGYDTWNANSYGGPGYYYSVFWEGMPDFNLKNADTVAYHKESLKFWLDRGVDGMRFDAIEVLIEKDKGSWDKQPESYAFMKQMRDLLDQYPNRYMVCEAPGDPDAAAINSSCRSAFAFNFSSSLKNAAKGSGAADSIAGFPYSHPTASLATLLSNHDSFAGNRPYTEFNGNEQHYKLAAAAMLTLPGIPFIYYGEEVGMSNSTAYSSQDWNLRTPMSWTADAATAGFTTGTPFRKPTNNIATHNVAVEQGEPGSLLTFYTTLINLRKSDPALSMGLYQVVPVDTMTGNPLAFVRRYGSQATLVVLNYANTATSLSLSLGQDFASATFDGVYPAGSGGASADTQGKLVVSAPALGVLIYRTRAGVNEPYLGAELFVRGEMNGWGATDRLSYLQESTYQASINLKAKADPYLFKIADSGWANYNFGGIHGETVTPGKPVQLEQTGWQSGGVGHDLKLAVTQDGTYLITLDARDPLNPKLTVRRM
jgi:alpha-amylase